MSSTSKIVENKGLRTAVLISALLISVSSIIGTIYATIYGVRYNAKEIVRVEGKVDASHTENIISNKEIASKIQENRDYILQDEYYQKMTENNAKGIKDLSGKISSIAGDVKVLLSRSNQ